MKRYLPLLCALSLVFGSAVAAWAQTAATAPPGPPPVLQIFREEVKVGKAPMHEKFETNFVRAFAKAKWPTHYLAISTLTGPSEAWYLTGYDSFDAWEKDRQVTEKAAALMTELDQLGQKDAEFISNGRSIAAIFRKDLSYHESVSIYTMRYFSVTTYRVRPGHNQDFEELRKLVNAAHEKAKVDEHWAVFQVVSGAPAGTFLFFMPHKSLAELDAFPAKHGKTYEDAVGDEGRKKLRELSAAAILNSESNLFAFSPKMSYPGPEAIAADPDFWAPKKAAAKPAAKPAAAAEEAKPAAPAKKAPAKKQ